MVPLGAAAHQNKLPCGVVDFLMLTCLSFCRPYHTHYFVPTIR